MKEKQFKSCFLFFQDFLERKRTGHELLSKDAEPLTGLGSKTVQHRNG